MSGKESQSGFGMRERRLISRSTASRMKSERLFSPASSSIRAATSADSRTVVTTVSELRLSGGRPMRRVVPESCVAVKFAPISYSLIDGYIVFAYKGQTKAGAVT
jgi:hypothetical protein